MTLNAWDEAKYWAKKWSKLYDVNLDQQIQIKMLQRKAEARERQYAELEAESNMLVDDVGRLGVALKVMNDKNVSLTEELAAVKNRGGEREVKLHDIFVSFNLDIEGEKRFRKVDVTVPGKVMMDR